MSVVIAGFARSPFTRAMKGKLSMKRPDDIASEVINALIRDNNLNPELIEDLIVGTAFPEAEQGYNIARLLIFLTDLPETVPGVTINRFCGSSMQAIHDAAGRISLGAGDAFIAGGIESMSRIPMTGFNPMPNPKLIELYPSIKFFALVTLKLKLFFDPSKHKALKQIAISKAKKSSQEK